MTFSLQQDDILLRTFDLTEADILFLLIDENRNHLRRWFSWVDTMKAVEDVVSYLKDEQIKITLGKSMYLGIWNREVLSGIISLEKIDRVNQKGVLGYWLSSASEGKGTMHTACNMLIDYAFNTLNLHRIDVDHIEENIRSETLIKKLGFIYEGRTRESSFLNGKYVSHKTYGLLAKEWRGNSII